MPLLYKKILTLPRFFKKLNKNNGILKFSKKIVFYD